MLPATVEYRFDRFGMKIAAAHDMATQPGVCLGVLCALLACSETVDPTSIPSPAMASADSRVTVTDFGAIGDGETNDACAIQKALDHVNQVGGGEVYIPPGQFAAQQPIRIYSNTTLRMADGAIVRREFSNFVPDNKSCAKHRGRGLVQIGASRNVRIIGGTFDGSGHRYPDNFNILGGVGIKNLRITGTRFLNVRGFHAIDLARASDVLIEGARFLGFLPDDLGKSPQSEFIQLDPDLANGGSGNERVTIRDCYFGANPTTSLGSAHVAIGNHASVPGQVSRDIVIVGNTFEGARRAAINPINFRNVVISGNHFRGGRVGVYLQTYAGSDAKSGNRSIAISHNTFTDIAGPALELQAHTGRSQSKHRNVVFSGNTITTNSERTVVEARWCSSLTVVGNTVSGVVPGDVASGPSGLANITDCNQVKISNNNARDMKRTAIFMHGEPSSDVQISDNMFVNCARGVHVSSASYRLAVTGNTIIDPDPTRDGIGLDSGADAAVIRNNVIQFSASLGVGVKVSGSAGSNIDNRGNSVLHDTQP